MNTFNLDSDKYTTIYRKFINYGMHLFLVNRKKIENLDF